MQDVERIVSHDLPIVGGVYPLKVNGIPQWPVTFLLPELPPRRADRLQQVRYLGAGFLCVQRRVFERIIEDHGPQISYRCPLTGRTEYDFWRPFVHKGVYLSEDYGFCEVAGRLGFEVYADWKTTLGHIGTITYPAQSFNQEEVRHYQDEMESVIQAREGQSCYAVSQSGDKDALAGATGTGKGILEPVTETSDEKISFGGS